MEGMGCIRKGEKYMEILVIYDKEGLIISRSSGSVKEPVGIPFMWLVIPEGKKLVSIDVSEEIHKPIFEDIPKSEVDLLKEELEDVNFRMQMSEQLNYTSLEAVVSVYEAIYPFLPN